MLLKYNPFRPGSIVHPGMFAGRMAELEILEKALFQTENGNPTHFLIHGERGIGKSSLLMTVNAFARGEVESFNSQKYSFITINVELEPSDDYRKIVHKVAQDFERELRKNHALQASLGELWKFITSWEILGVKYNRDVTPIEAMIEELADKLTVVANELFKDKRGIYIFIDEADKPLSSAGLGEFVKVLTERLTKRGTRNVGIGVVGISNVINKMRDSHASSVRVMTPIQLEPLLPDERKEVVLLGLAEAEHKNGYRTGITDEAIEMIGTFSEGYPHFIQQYAFCAFDQDSNNNIDESDVRDGLTKENGALHLLGMRYFENMYTDEIHSDDYRTVLQIVAQHMPEHVTRKQIQTESGLKSHTVSNAINALKKRGSLIAISGRTGQFRLPSRSFAVWIQAFKIAKN